MSKRFTVTLNGLFNIKQMILGMLLFLIMAAIPIQAQIFETAKLKPSDHIDTRIRFAESVAISGDYAISGALGESSVDFSAGAVYMYEKDSFGNWMQVQKIVDGDGERNDGLGIRVAIGGNYAAATAWGDDDGGNGAGAIYIYERDNSGIWQFVAKKIAKCHMTVKTLDLPLPLTGNTSLSEQPVMIPAVILPVRYTSLNATPAATGTK